MSVVARSSSPATRDHDRAREPLPLIPTYRYCSPEYVQKEWDGLWRRTWLFACREEDVEATGDYHEFTIGKQSILIVRSAEGRLQAFYNACLHRGTRLKRGCGRATELRCMFHAWCWNLDGSNREITDAHDFPGLSAEGLQLPEVRLETWAGFVFVNLDREAEPLATYLGTVPALFERFKLGEMRIQSHRQAIIPANWKVPVDNFNESYHVVGLHPQQLAFIDDTNVIYECLGLHSMEVCRSGTPSARLGGVLDEDDVLDLMLDARRTTFHQGDAHAGNAMRAFERRTVPDGQRARDVIIDLKRERLRQAGRDAGSISDGDLIDGHGLHLFPNTVLFMSYGEAFIVRTRPNGSDPDRCVLDIINLEFRADRDGGGRAPVQVIEDIDNHDWGLVIGQDLQCFREVQIGLHSEALPGLHLAEYQEKRIRLMHQNLERYVGS
jgi:phenylpropionate dioxygenase-like ring-hydroxylating dioxygenase large terminal subunit